MNSTKQCTKCRNVLPLDRFSKDRSRRDGLQLHCKDCVNAAQRDWYRRNREKHASKMREWSTNNPDKVKEYSRRSYLRNKDKVNEGVRRRRAERPETSVVYRANGKAREVGVPGRIDVSEWIELKRRYGNKCVCCGACEPDIVLSIDHIIPLSAGGPNIIENIQPLCVQCNCEKGQTDIDYRPEEGNNKVHWSEETLAVFDVESTGTDPRHDRIVEAAFVLVDPDGSFSKHSFLEIVNPGIEIPKEASDVHGITTARAQAEGVDAKDAVTHLASLFRLTHRFGRPVVIYNAPFDWPMMLAECDRYGVDIPRDIHLIDPLLIDRHMDRYRKGGRKLEVVARHYGVDLSNAHSAEADAVATAGVARALCSKYEGLKQHSLAELQGLQRQWFDEWRDGMNSYFKRNGRSDRITGTWPGTDLLEEGVAS